jgi:hypothetical protein
VRSLFAVVVLLASAGVAHAEDTERLVLPEKRGLVQAFLAIDLSTDAVGKPISIQPDVWYGVKDEITVGLVHSSRAVTGFVGGTDFGLCITGTENGCEGFYSNAGVEGRYHVKDGPLSVALQGGLHASDLNPFQMALKVGVMARWRKDKLVVDAAPSIFAGITARDGTAMVAQSNKEIVYVPLTVLYQAHEKAAAALQTGVVIPFEATGDRWTLPLSLGVHANVTPEIFAELMFSFLSLAGGELTNGVDARSLTVGGGYAF